MNYIIEKVRAFLQRKEVVPPEDIEELCDEAQALQDLNDRLMQAGEHAKHD